MKNVVLTFSISRIGLKIGSLEPDHIFSRKIKTYPVFLFVGAVCSLPLRYTERAAWTDRFQFFSHHRGPFSIQKRR